MNAVELVAVVLVFLCTCELGWALPELATWIRRRRDAIARTKRIAIIRDLRLEVNCPNGEHRMMITDDFEPHALWSMCIDCGYAEKLGFVFHASNHRQQPHG